MPVLHPDLFPQYPLADYLAHREEIDAALKGALHSGHYILGGEVNAFEGEFASWIGSQSCIGVANGTDAIEVLLRALEIGPGDKVVVPSHTAVASASAVVRAGAEPVFADIDPATFTLCPKSLAVLLKSPMGRGVKAVLAVHIYGHPVAWDELKAVTDEHQIVLLEDCAQSHGAIYQGRKVGSLGLAAAFSFYPTKNLGAIGDAGAITTSDASLAEKIRVVRQYGWRQRYISSMQGVNSRLDELQAAILRVKLRSLGGQIARRRELAAMYAEGLRDSLLATVPEVMPGCDHAYHLYVIRSTVRDALMKHLTEHGVPAALHYPAAIHQQLGYTRQTEQSPALPQTENAVREILTLPLHPYLTTEAVHAVCATIDSFA
jgi:dTDP-4-amino-4,6-dideoxygalactose transaminase